jgi:hypothetical protein
MRVNPFPFFLHAAKSVVLVPTVAVALAARFCQQVSIGGFVPSQAYQQVELQAALDQVARWCCCNGASDHAGSWTGGKRAEVLHTMVGGPLTVPGSHLLISGGVCREPPAAGLIKLLCHLTMRAG